MGLNYSSTTGEEGVKGSVIDRRATVRACRHTGRKHFSLQQNRIYCINQKVAISGRQRRFWPLHHFIQLNAPWLEGKE